MEETKQKKKFRFPISVKTVLIIVVFGLVLAEIAMVYFSITSSNSNKAKYKEEATELSTTVALSVDIDEVKELKNYVIDVYDSYDPRPVRPEEGETQEFKQYMAAVAGVKNLDAYKHLQTYLHKVKEANADTDGIYIAFVDYELKRAIYLVYDQENEVYPAGVVDPLYEEDYPMVDNPKLGFVASIYESELDGQTLVTAGAPIVDENDKVVAYALVDFSMEVVRRKQASSIVRLFIYLISTVALLCVLGIVVIHFILIKPVKTLQNAAKSYDVNDPEGTHEKFVKLKINTHDEFADLAENMKKMESDINNKIGELTKINGELIASQRVASQMAEMANKDALTGVRNKNSFTRAAESIDSKVHNGELIDFGVVMVDLNYLKNINDEYGHTAGDSALIKLCNLICATFVHSPVYRIGGDEFVALLRNNDYKYAEKLIYDFKIKIRELIEDKELKPYERISAAIGYSVFDPKTDECINDVFKRADADMYECKHAMKKHYPFGK